MLNFASLSLIATALAAQPNIVYLVVDDWGWANFAPHRVAGQPGNEEFPTPNLAALAADGLMFDRMYAHKFCGPSRAAIQTGRLPIHVTVLDDNLADHNPKDPISGFQGVPRNMTGIAQKLKNAGYSTHMVGKWHCGLASPDHTPHGRGYDTSLNYFDAANDHWTLQYSSCPDAAGNPSVTDFWDTTHGAIGQNNSWECSQATQGNPAFNCTWEDDKLQARLLQRIEAHNASQPLFLFWSAHTVHEPYEVPTADLDKFSSVDVLVRRYYAAMVSHLDGLVPGVVNALKAKGMWENTLFVVSSDNGGPLARTPPGNTLDGTSGANNFPLRGGKIGVFEGGIRVNAFASGGFLPAAVRGTTTSGWAHVADFYATFCALAGVDPTDYRAQKAGLPPIDSLDLSGLLLGTNATSPRTEVPIGSSDVDDHSGNTIVAGLIDKDGWKLLIEAKIAPAFPQGPIYPNTTAPGENAAPCGDPNGKGPAKGPGCLFNVLTDPFEEDDLASKNPAKVAELRARIAELQKGAFNPDRGTHDREMCLTAWGKNKGFLGPWLP